MLTIYMYIYIYLYGHIRHSVVRVTIYIYAHDKLGYGPMIYSDGLVNSAHDLLLNCNCNLLNSR